MPTPTYADEFQVLRVQLETSLPAPSVVSVTSATIRDGKDFAADGLATALQAAGYRTLTIRTDQNTSKTDEWPVAESLQDLLRSGTPRVIAKVSTEAPDFMVIASATIEQAASRDAIARLFSVLRLQYQYIVVNAGLITQSPLARLLASESDGVMLTVRQARRILYADSDAASMLIRDGAKLLGVVSISEQAIRRAKEQFSKRKAGLAKHIVTDAFDNEPHSQAGKHQTV